MRKLIAIVENTETNASGTQRTEFLDISPMDSGLQIPNKAGRCAQIRRKAGIEFLAKQGSFELTKLYENEIRIVSPTNLRNSKQIAHEK